NQYLPFLIAGVAGLSLLWYFGKPAILLTILSLFILTRGDLGEAIRWSIIFAGVASIIYLNFHEKLKSPDLKIPVPKPLLYLTLFLTLFTFISATLSLNPTAGYIAGAKQFFFLFVIYLLYRLCNSDKIMFTYLGVMVISAVVISGGVILDLFSMTISSLAANQGPLRVMGSFGSTNAQAAVLSTALVLIPAFFHILSEKHKVLRFSVIPVFLFIASGLIFYNSRAAILLLISGLSLYFVILKPAYITRILAASVILLLVILFVKPVNDLVVFFFRVEHLLNIRDHLWAISADLIKEFPVFGTGPEQFKEHSYKYMPVMLGSYEEGKIKFLFQVSNPAGLSHNFLLFKWTELGIPGLISALSLYGIFGYYSIKTLIQTKMLRNYYFYIAASTVAIGTGFFVRSIFESINLLTYGWFMVDTPFWLIFIVLIYIYNKTGENSSEFSSKESSDIS
ncbi:MAG: O-antigen ligase family protein, partial [Ignavibacteriaceae bacterium]|nr:O-antigen ligase family protein [Ignavibacteriaceae bacterium]